MVSFCSVLLLLGLFSAIYFALESAWGVSLSALATAAIFGWALLEIASTTGRMTVFDPVIGQVVIRVYFGSETKETAYRFDKIHEIFAVPNSEDTGPYIAMKVEGRASYLPIVWIKDRYHAEAMQLIKAFFLTRPALAAKIRFGDK